MSKIKYTPRKGLRPDTVKYIREVVKSLNDKDAALPIDLGAISMLAENYNLFLEAGEQIASEGLLIYNSKGDQIKNPLIKVQTDAQIQAVKIMTEFGLTVKSRERIKGLGGDEAGDDDPLRELLAKRRR